MMFKSKELIIELIASELESELNIQHESDNADIIDDIIVAYIDFIKTHFASLEYTIHITTLKDMLNTYNYKKGGN